MKKRNKRRRKLLIPLFFSTFFLITTTYAWFSANRMVSIESLNVHVQADGGLEVSTNAIDWKQVVTVQDIMEARESTLLVLIKFLIRCHLCLLVVELEKES